ncbi:MAG: phage holin family protein [Oscillospiraceae bacterium]
MNTKSIYYTALTVISAVGTTIAQIFGGWDTALQTLVIFMAVDYITGILCAIIWKRSPKTADGAFESKASIKGLFRKAAILFVVLIAYKLDILAGTTAVRTAVIMFFIANDGFSIIENLGVMGVPMPKVIKNAFELLKEKGEFEKNGK